MIFLLAGFPFLTSAASTGSKTGLIVPLYSYPTDNSWSALIQLKHTHSAIPFVAIINPNNGAGHAVDSNYVKWIQNLKAAGISVIGYIALNFGSKSLASVKSEMVAYKNWYGLNGIFFDEMSNSVNFVNYYRALAAEASSLHFSMTMGNPGTTINSQLVGIFSNICIYENPGMPSMAQISGYSWLGKHGFSYIAYSVSGLPNQNMLKNTAQYVQYLYITNLGGSNPYNGLPSYLATELAILSQ